MSALMKETPESPVLAIGLPYGGGFFSGITLEDGKRYINITASAAHELVGSWGKYGEKIEGTDSFTDSRANTEAMAASGSELAARVLTLNIDGFADWAIPARDVQELQYRHLKPTTEENWQYGRSGDNPNSVPIGLLYSEEDPQQTTVEAFREDGPEAFQDRVYWSSSQRSANNAFSQDFDDGGQYDCGKGYEFRVRPVRRELIID
ncbi:DUF1566 domain-containing protein [Pseudomonas amygdali]|uniref:DUF1566 domain-containing protein n=2 Tax=Pseudomonas amygdali TaxID=47877 RepID=A0AAD0LYT6_PSEAV|nr:DUF1566 domain-containing protein [Pseudomonas amygdali]AXH55448.1 DUF1566 domain-containing protein [Pseudomonas amygdali pv. lachrymans str. M301315]AXH55574.1 DUF1566 domain-containing protein [Pseudomonas amygdali pv. lachrymans str. M301315]